jgi:iron complex transport system substrate-binding protein
VPGALGTATLKAPPQRVAAVGYLRDTDLAVALGVDLVVSSRNTIFNNGLAAWVHPKPGAKFLYTNGAPSFEDIAAARPDVILANDDFTLASDYPLLSKIAPTLSYGHGVNRDTWTVMTQRAGDLLGKRALADQLVATVQSKIASTRAAHPELAGKTFTFGPVNSAGQIYTISSTTDPGAGFFAQLGMRLSPTVTTLPQSTTPNRAQISPEQIQLLDADIVIISYDTPKTRATFEANPLFKNLPSVKRGSYLGLDLGTAVALAFPSVLSIPYALDAVAPKLSAAAEHGA